MEAGSAEGTVSYIIQKVLEELRLEFSQVQLLEKTTLSGALAQGDRA